MNKLKAYTVMEMIVVMLLGGIVISIAFTSFRILSTQYNHYQKSNGEIADIALLNKLMSRDISEAEMLVRTYDGFECRGGRRRVVYQLDGHYLLRHYLITDTFPIKPLEVKFSFLGQPQEIPEYPIDQFEFSGGVGDEVLFFSFQKLYGADILMEYQSR
ncbi:MAG TPA: hypothetical protein VIK89_15865 [Cytophagaceae bacterium]